jgi:outer membrane receptor protein involved in Fe transport
MTFMDWQGNASYGTLDGYVKLDFSAGHTFEFDHIFRELSLTARVENILNQQYEEKFGHPAPGINFLAGFSAKFR